MIKQSIIGENIYSSTSNTSYTVSYSCNGIVKIVDFKNKKIINMELEQFNTKKSIDENMYAGFSSAWLNGNEFEN